jgi:hypothetical protein
MEAWRRATRPGSRILFLNFAYVFPIPPILAWRGLDTVNMRGSRLANAFAPASRGMTNASNWRRDPPGYPGIGPLHIAEAELRTAIFTPDNVCDDRVPAVARGQGGDMHMCCRGGR